MPFPYDNPYDPRRRNPMSTEELFSRLGWPAGWAFTGGRMGGATHKGHPVQPNRDKPWAQAGFPGQGEAFGHRNSPGLPPGLSGGPRGAPPGVGIPGSSQLRSNYPLLSSLGD